MPDEATARGKGGWGTRAQGDPALCAAHAVLVGPGRRASQLPPARGRFQGEREMTRRFTACLLTALAGLLLSAAPVLADPPDRFDPPVVTGTLGAGESMTVDKTL